MRLARPLLSPPASVIVAAAMALVAGCGGAGTLPPIFVCTPACPTGATCGESGCVPIGGAVDLSVAAGPDMPVPCGGACGGATPYCNQGQVCVACLEDSHCPTGSVCRPLGGATACVPGCADDSRCGGGASRCCAGACTDTARDPANCGDCGAACAGAQAHSASACVNSVCLAGTCEPGWADCNGDAADGCEVSVRADVANCGACGRRCAIKNAVPACAGSCYVAACDFGWADCNGTSVDGCEIAVVSDPKNCGACGNACAGVPHAQVACINTSCALTTCDNGFADCNARTVDGCEIAVGTDVFNCGRCGNQCAQGLICSNGGCTCKQCNLPNARSTCVNFVCAVDKCLGNFLDCDAQSANGCEANGAVDARNCGGCGVVCGGNTPFCQGGVCSQVGASCLGILKSNPKAPSGTYAIDPDGNGPIQPFSAYCDMTTDGGGWTVVYGTDALDGEVGLASDTDVSKGDPTAFGYYNLTRAVKVALSASASESLWKRKDGAWIKADGPMFDASLTAANSHMHAQVNLVASDGAKAQGAIGYTNFQMTGGGDYGVSMFPDGATCQGNTVTGFDHHSANYYHLNCGCQRQYLYSYSNNVQDSDQSYNINTGLGAWTATQACVSIEGGGISFYAAVR